MGLSPLSLHAYALISELQRNAVHKKYATNQALQKTKSKNVNKVMLTSHLGSKYDRSNIP